MPEQVTSLASTEKARKYLYVINELTKTWRDVSFTLSNFKRATGRYINGGRQAIIPLETATSGAFRFSDPGEAPSEAGTATYDEAVIDFTTMSTSIEYDWHAKLAGQTDKQSFIQLRTKAIADAVEVMGYRWSHAIFMPKTNAVARVKTANITPGVHQLYKEGETTGAGAGGTFGARYIFKKGYLAASANTTTKVCEKGFDGWADSVDRVNDKITTGGLLSSTIANDDYLFWGTKDRTSKGRGLTGLPMIVNDGVDYAVFEGRDRTVAGNEDWQATVSRSFGSGNIELEMINQSINLERKLPGVHTDVVMYGLKVQRLHFQQMATLRRAMLPVSDINGAVYNGGFKALPVDYGDRQLAAMANVEIPDNVMYGLSWDALALAMLSEPVWIDEGEGQFKHIPDTFSWKAHLAGVGQLVSKLPAAHWLTTGITP